jgi:hypothetical protein
VPLEQLNLKLPPEVLADWRSRASAEGCSMRDWLLVITGSQARPKADLEACQATSKTAPLPTPKSEPPLTRSGALFPDWFRLGCAGGASVCSWFAWLVALVVVFH